MTLGENPKTLSNIARADKSRCGLRYDWGPEMVAEFCGRIASGEAIRNIAGRDGFPSEMCIYRKLAADPDFEAKVSIARAAQQDYEMDACIHMADEATFEDWQVVKLRIWARQWRASKLAPKKYGDKVEQKHVGPDGEALTITRVEHVIVNVSAGDLIERATEPALIEGTYSSD